MAQCSATKIVRETQSQRGGIEYCQLEEHEGKHKWPTPKHGAVNDYKAEAKAWKARAEELGQALYEANRKRKTAEAEVVQLREQMTSEIRSMAIAYHTLHERPNEPTAVMVEGFEKCAHRVCYHADKVLRKSARALVEPECDCAERTTEHRGQPT